MFYRKGREATTCRPSEFSQGQGERSGAGEEEAPGKFQAEESIKAPLLVIKRQSCLIFMNSKLSIIILHAFCVVKYTETKKNFIL